MAGKVGTLEAEAQAPVLTAEEMKARDAERRLGSGGFISMDEAVSKLLAGELTEEMICVPDDLGRTPHFLIIASAEIKHSIFDRSNITGSGTEITLKLRTVDQSSPSYGIAENTHRLSKIR